MSLLWVYVVLFALAVGESSAFLGLAVPGEAAVLAAGETAIDAVESASVFTAALVATVGILVYLVHRQRTAAVAGEIVAAVDER